MQKLEKPQRVNINGIICEYLFFPGSARAIILLEGLPVVPQRIEFMNLLREGGYSVFYPRFRGTWESEGIFLEKSPVEDVLEVAGYLRRGGNLFTGYEFSTINVIAASFAGAVALSLPKSEYIQKLVSLSPVFDFKKVIGIETLKAHLRSLFTMAYRFNDERWNNLIQNEIIAPIHNFDYVTARQHLVIAGALDEQVPAEVLEEFCLQRSIQLKIYPNMGHLSYSRVSKEVLDDILTFLSES